MRTNSYNTGFRTTDVPREKNVGTNNDVNKSSFGKSVGTGIKQTTLLVSNLLNAIGGFKPEKLSSKLELHHPASVLMRGMAHIAAELNKCEKNMQEKMQGGIVTKGQMPLNKKGPVHERSAPLLMLEDSPSPKSPAQAWRDAKSVRTRSPSPAASEEDSPSPKSPAQAWRDAKSVRTRSPSPAEAQNSSSPKWIPNDQTRRKPSTTLQQSVPTAEMSYEKQELNGKK